MNTAYHHHQFSYFFQISVLESAAKSNPNAWFWIKADGVDVVKGLCESTRGVWAGDIDLNDGQLKRLYEDLQNEKKWINGIGLKDRRHQEAVRRDLSIAMNKLVTELQFVHSGKCE